MKLQVRIAYETAEMLELLKEHYQEQNEINFSKGEVLSKAILDTYDMWKETDWNRILGLPITIDKNYEISSGALRPKFQISVNIEPKITELKKIIQQNVGAKYVTIGAAIKFVLRLVIYELQNKNNVSTESVIFDTLDKFTQNNMSTETKETLKNFVNEVMTKLEVNDLL
ncbi:hypothetical protein [Oceanobacillus massiliensis]|uniref:hypothetical protein n=1 Tax=Oceanobacillus massiliensis TaxID=1465765 RepID=UPI000288398A|nr:hypothetical protein [Oceanobacillus massiliensis]